jgi:uncharacterized membrane protein YhaH (DUF805 family)
MSAALVSQHEMLMRRIVVCGLSGYTIFSNFTSYTAPISKEKIIEQMLYILIFIATLSETILYSKKKWAKC